MFPCNKGHLVTAYLDTIAITLVLSTQKWGIYGDVPIGISSCLKVRTEGYVTNVTNTDIELVYILFNNETTLRMRKIQAVYLVIFMAFWRINFNVV